MFKLVKKDEEEVSLAKSDYDINDDLTWLLGDVWTGGNLQCMMQSQTKKPLKEEADDL